MSSHETYALLSIVLGIISLWPYIKTTLAGRTRPHIYTWFIWAVMNGLACYIQIMGNAGAGAWPTACAALLCVVVVLLSVRHGEKNITLTDKISFALAICIIPLWMVTKNPLSALLIAICIDVLAFYPTFRKAWSAPDSENALTFFLGGMSFMLSVFAVELKSVETVLFPAYVTVMNFTLVSMLLMRRRLVRQ